MVARYVQFTALCGVLIALLASCTYSAAAQNIGHFGKNRLEFATVNASSLPDATGTGIVDYKGGKEPSSQWRASFRFTGLEAGANYTVVVQGRFGETDSPDAELLTTICSFAADDAGEGGCFWYFRGLVRLNLVQLRTGDENGARVLEADRFGDQGSITTDPNRFSPGGEIPARKKPRNGKS